jgi:uncharacterized phiE125 gp8 family phage protein
MLITVTAATVEPVTLAQAKAHLRVMQDFDDELIATQISAARERVELNTGRALAAATYRLAVPGSCSTVHLPLFPVATVTEVSYLGTGDVRIVVDPASYYTDSNRSTLTLARSISTSAVNVTFTTAPAVIPAALKAAILLIVADLYEHAEEGAEVGDNPAVERLITPYRLNLGV